MERVLAFGSHPDDVELMCAGTLALLAREGHEIHIAVMAGGEMGSAELPPQRIREQRLREAESAAAVIGARFHYAGGYDIEIEYNAEYRRRTIRVMREVAPTIVFAPPPSDYLIDHEETSRLVRTAAFIATCPNYDCLVPTTPTSRIPYLYYWDAIGSKDIFGQPLPLSCAVDISDTLSIKERMLACHASQREWLRRTSGWDEYLETMKRTAAEMGRRAGCVFAEGFVQHRGSNYPADNVLAVLLGARCIELRSFGHGQERAE